MKKKFVKTIAAALVILLNAPYVAEASTIIMNNDVQGILEEKSLISSYFNFKNIWGGNALKLEFDTSSMQINAIQQSGNFNNYDDNFTFKVIDSNSKEALISEKADSRYVSDFINKINGREFKFGDIISLQVNSDSKIGNPTLVTGDSTQGTNCVDKIQYFEITEEGIVDYTPDITVSPLKILGMDTVYETTLIGKTNENVNLKVLVEDKVYESTSYENGEFSIEIGSINGFTAHTKIEVRVGEIKVDVYPEILGNQNMIQKTNTGYSYILNADLETLTTPFDSSLFYPREFLSEDGKKAWDIVYSELLKYENINDEYPRDAEGNVKYYIDYASHGINITKQDADYIQSYLPKCEPRMFLLKTWKASPVYENGNIVGQNFYIGNDTQNGDAYRQWLLQTEEAVSYILSKITPEMSVYQIIKVVQSELENMVSYKNVPLCGDMRGTFITKEAICGGYAKGLEYLLLRLGIQNIWVNGYAGGAHAWNYINLYGTWYLADATWGGKNWYLRGSEDTKGRTVYDTYPVMPTLAKDSILWELGDRGQTIANLNGIVNFENNNDGTIKITYEDKDNINTTMNVNTSIDNYAPIEMSKDEDGIWSAVISYENYDLDTFDFYFTVDEIYNTIGDAKSNYLVTETLNGGMTNIVLSTLNVDINDLKDLISTCNYKKEDYTKSTYDKYSKALEDAINISDNSNAYLVDIALAYRKLQLTISELVMVNNVEFKGYKDEVFLKLQFDTEAKKFVATSNSKMVHPYQYSRMYTTIEHYDQKGALKNTYSVRANTTADKMAEELNEATYVEGDYLKFSHLEKDNRFVINGYIEDAPKDLSTGARDVDLSNSYFYLMGENLRYSNKQLDLSADKTELINKISELKEITGDSYTKTSFKNLNEEIAKAEELVNDTNVFEEEITNTLEKLNNAYSNLRVINEIVFKGYNNNEFLKVSLDTENNLIKAVSNGEVANRFISGRYAEVALYDKKGNLKFKYAINGGHTADEMAEELNNLQYVDGDYLRLYHAEKNNRFVINGYVVDAPYDLSTGSTNLDLSIAYFYLGGENIQYSTEQLDLSADKIALLSKIEEAKNIDSSVYTKTTYEKLLEAIAEGEVIIAASNVLEEEITDSIAKIQENIDDLREINKIDFKGYNNVVFMTLGFDTENNKFIAESNGLMIHPYQYSRLYVKVEHFDQKGNLKGTYSGIADKTADEMANALNNLSYESGDYIKLSHLEKNNRLVINGFVENAPYDLSTDLTNLDLSTAYFYLGEENIKYSNEQLDLSADKTQLVEKIAIAKEISGETYTKTTFNNLIEAIQAGEDLVNATNVYESEINSAIEKITTMTSELKEINIVEFKGYNNVVFLKLGFDKENNKFIAESNSEVIHPYHYSRVYATIYHYDKDNNIKGSYSVKANETADNMAAALNEAIIEEGDYLKFEHLEQQNRLAIKGYINGLDQEVSNGVGNLNLTNSKFSLDNENLTYSIIEE